MTFYQPPPLLEPEEVAAQARPTSSALVDQLQNANDALERQLTALQRQAKAPASGGAKAHAAHIEANERGIVANVERLDHLALRVHDLENLAERITALETTRAPQPAVERLQARTQEQALQIERLTAAISPGGVVGDIARTQSLLTARLETLEGARTDHRGLIVTLGDTRLGKRLAWTRPHHADRIATVTSKPPAPRSRACWPAPWNASTRWKPRPPR